MLASDWKIDARSLEYAPVGFGTHHYVTDDRQWFVNVDDITRSGWVPGNNFDALDRSLRVARALRDEGLEFVSAPIERTAGGSLARLGPRYAVSVYPFVDGTSNAYGDYATEDEKSDVLHALGRIHSMTSALPDDLARRDTLEIPNREVLYEALDDLAREWTSGPYAEPARAALTERQAAVRKIFDAYDDVTAQISPDGWVITHGEPHAANVMRARDGSLLFIDWDTTAIAPRERDLWQVDPTTDAHVRAYVSGGGMDAIDPVAMELFRRWWDLAEIAV